MNQSPQQQTNISLHSFDTNISTFQNLLPPEIDLEAILNIFEECEENIQQIRQKIENFRKNGKKIDIFKFLKRKVPSCISCFHDIFSYI